MEKQLRQAKIDIVIGVVLFTASIVFAVMVCYGLPSSADKTTGTSTNKTVTTEATTEAATEATEKNDSTAATVTKSSNKSQQAAATAIIQTAPAIMVTDTTITDEPQVAEAANEAIETAQVAEESVDTTITEEPTATSPYADLLDDIDSDDREVLKRLIYHECRGNGGEAVAEVVLNRMQDSRFPDTLQGVVYESGQFTPASFLFSASINEPGPFEECGRIVNEVLDPNYQRTLPANYVYFNSIGPGSSDYVWKGGNVFYAG